MAHYFYLPPKFGQRVEIGHGVALGWTGAYIVKGVGVRPGASGEA